MKQERERGCLVRSRNENTKDMTYEVNGKPRMNIGQALENAIRQVAGEKPAKNPWELRKAA